MAKQTKSFLYGMLAGSIIGSVTALLFAPKPGKELRKDIAEGAQQIGEQTAKIAGQVGEKTSKIARQIGTGATQIAGKARGTVHSWRFGQQNDDALTIADADRADADDRVSEQADRSQ
ncbi:YtxH domain-containing protein [Paenibacillus sp. GCM10027626]|uniref:YtxH domain-containing protein n=1 Tax=Paenibacillus sp. GCM10027626 TaxID=3273411 RepID=UPI00362A09C4